MSYFGGKLQDGVYQTIINQIPMHQVYIEPFFGGGAIMQKKKPAFKNIGLDLCKNALSMFPKMENVDLVNGSFFDFFSPTVATIEKSAFVAPESSRSDIGNFLFTGSELRYRIGKNIYKRSEVFVYCDPPYPHETRKSDKRYNFELSTDEHFKILQIIKCLDCSVAISTYPNVLYEKELKDWRLVEFESMTRGGWKAKEWLFMNYGEPKFLHDDRYIGFDSGNRQDIKRRIARTEKRLLSWDGRERIKLLNRLFDNLPDDEKEYFRQVKAF